MEEFTELQETLKKYIYISSPSVPKWNPTYVQSELP